MDDKSQNPGSQGQQSRVMVQEPPAAEGEAGAGNTECPDRRKQALYLSYGDMGFSVLTIIPFAIFIKDFFDATINLTWKQVPTKLLLALVCPVGLLFLPLLSGWIAWELWKAVKVTTPVPLSLRKAKLYRLINLILAVTYFIGCIILFVAWEIKYNIFHSYVYRTPGAIALIWSLIRVGFIVIAHRFIQQLQTGAGGVAATPATTA